MRSFALLALFSLLTSSGFAQQPGDSYSSSALTASPGEGGAAPAPNGTNLVTPTATRSGAFSSVAVGAKVGILGIGVEAATPLSSHLNLRGGANFFGYTANLSSDGINYDANLHFRSVEASLDWFPWARGFHLSPGALLYNGNRITANAAVPGGDTFTLNNYTYTSSPSDPVSGTGEIKFNKAAPKFTVGWGNLIPRNGSHFSIPVEVGFAYAGTPKVALGLHGTACYDYQGLNYCSDVATNPVIQANVAAQQQKIAHDVSPARFFPLISTGFAYRF